MGVDGQQVMEQNPSLASHLQGEMQEMPHVAMSEDLKVEFHEQFKTGGDYNIGRNCSEQDYESLMTFFFFTERKCD